MTDQELTAHTAALLRLDVTTNALTNLVVLVRDMQPEIPAEIRAYFENDINSAMANARAALEIARGQRSDVPDAIRSQRMPHDMAQRFLDEGTLVSTKRDSMSSDS